MQPYVITISRQFSSMGRAIAKELSNILEIDFYDRDIVEETSKRLGLPISTVSNNEEFAKSKYFKRKYPLGMASSSLQDEIFLIQKNIIEDLAKNKSCIIVGRCADSILANNKNVLSVYVFAPYEERLKNCTQKLGMDESTARKLIKEIDNSRDIYHKRYCPEFKDCMTNKDILIDSSKFGIDGSAEILAEIAKKEFNL